jgi:hypothetical protein
MEGTFDSAKNQFKANYIQYFLTEQSKYKDAYESAQKTMDSILENTPDTPKEPIKLKPIREKSYTTVRQASQEAVPTQSWKYWTLGSLLLVTTVLSLS